MGKDACIARSLAVCRIGPYALPFDLCEERFYTPGLLAKLLANDTSYLEPEFEPPPLSCPPSSFLTNARPPLAKRSPTPHLFRPPVFFPSFTLPLPSSAPGEGQARNSTFFVPTNTTIPALSARSPTSSGSSASSPA